jgi:methionyl-tRNA formyltransferase
MNLLYFSSGPRERVLDALTRAGHQVGRVYSTDVARWPKVARTIAIANDRGIPVQIVRKSELIAIGDQVCGQICLSVGFAFLFPPPFLKAAKVCLNVHGSLLPQYAGARTLNWVIACGETHSGVTVHVVDEGVDTGPILLQRSFPLSPFETGRSLYRRTLEFEPQVVLDALALYEARGLSAVRPQSGQAVRFPDRVPEHSRLDPTKPLIELVDQIRAADPDAYPAFFEIEGQRVCVRLWRPDKPEDEADLV